MLFNVNFKLLIRVTVEDSGTVLMQIEAGGLFQLFFLIGRGRSAGQLALKSTFFGLASLHYKQKETFQINFSGYKTVMLAQEMQ